MYHSLLLKCGEMQAPTHVVKHVKHIHWTELHTMQITYDEIVDCIFCRLYTGIIHTSVPICNLLLVATVSFF